MKKKFLVATVLMATMISLGGCSETKNTTEPATQEVTTEMNTNTDEEQEEGGIGNPIEEVSYDKIVEVTGCNVTLPEDMEEATYLLINNELGEIRFKENNDVLDMTFRVQKADAFTDISGLYYDWKDITDGMILDYDTAEYNFSGDEGNIRLILWYNQYEKVMYSLSAQGKDLDGFDLYAIAANMAMTDVPVDDYPSNELEERTGKTEFDSYDEIISLLEGDEVYALVNILGHDGEVLLVASGTFDNMDGNMATIDATPYTMKSFGKVTADSMLSSQGTAYPLAIDDNGLIYCCSHRGVNAYCYGINGSDDTGIMVMKYICATDLDDNGDPVKVSGFYRNINDLSVLNSEAVDYAEDDVEALNVAFDEYLAAKVVNFITTK